MTVGKLWANGAAAKTWQTGDMPRSRLTRVLRGSMAAAFATFVALFVHAAAGGELPNWIGIVAPLVLSTMICTLLAGRRVNLIRLSIAVTLSQGLFHLLFVLGSGPAPSGSGHHHGEFFVPAPIAAAGGSTVDVSMWLGHALAAAVTIAAFYSAERATRALLELGARLRSWMLRVLFTPIPVVSQATSFSLAVAARIQRVRPFGFFPAATPRRGPPAFAA